MSKLLMLSIQKMLVAKGSNFANDYKFSSFVKFSCPNGEPLEMKLENQRA